MLKLKTLVFNVLCLKINRTVVPPRNDDDSSIQCNEDLISICHPEAKLRDLSYRCSTLTLYTCLYKKNLILL